MQLSTHAFLEKIGAGGADDEAAIQAVLAAVHTAWPAIRLDDALFLDLLLPRLGPDGVLATRLAGLQVEDLFLACAVLHLDAAAFAAFERTALRPLVAKLKKIIGSNDLADEILQTLRVRMVIGEGGAPPRLKEYQGRGSLASWVHVAGVRMALDLRAADARQRSLAVDAVNEQELLAENDPELAYIKSLYHEPFLDALREAMESLTAEQRNVIRYYIVDGLNIAEIGAIYRVHRATVARWIAEYRDLLLARSRALLVAKLGVSEQDLASLVRLMQSRLDLSIARLLPPVGEASHMSAPHGPASGKLNSP
jgi:RNA polymerase sigma-70 factor (ECF subfamily)